MLPPTADPGRVRWSHEYVLSRGSRRVIERRDRRGWQRDHLTAHDGGTRFGREPVYRMPNLWLAVLNRLFIQRRLAAESAEALRRLKLILERTPAEAPAQPV
jgi:hypothetical protein